MVSHLLWTPGCFDVRSAQMFLKNMLELFERMISSSLLEGTSYSPPLLVPSRFFSRALGLQHRDGCACCRRPCPPHPVLLSLFSPGSSLLTTPAAWELWPTAGHTRHLVPLPGPSQQPTPWWPSRDTSTDGCWIARGSCRGWVWVGLAVGWGFKFWFAFPFFSKLDIFTVRYKNIDVKISTK